MLFLKSDVVSFLEAGPGFEVLAKSNLCLEILTTFLFSLLVLTFNITNNYLSPNTFLFSSRPPPCCAKALAFAQQGGGREGGRRGGGKRPPAAFNSKKLFDSQKLPKTCQS